MVVTILATIRVTSSIEMFPRSLVVAQPNFLTNPRNAGSFRHHPLTSQSCY